MGVVPAAFTDESPAKPGRYAELAAGTVKGLIPGAALYPGLAVASAVVRSAGGVPQVVVTTNEGMGYLPQGFFLPPGVLHAFAEIDTEDFDRKWAGWVDPARILIDFVVTCEQRGDRMELLGLACSVGVGEEVKAMFPQAIPRVEPPTGGRPLGPENGRNRHRLQVLAPTFYDRLMRASERVRGRAAAAATRAAMALDVAAPFAAAGSPAMLLLRGIDPSPQQWAVLRDDYEQRVRVVGSMRPGFLSSGREDQQMVARYREAFLQLRVLETVLCWQALPDPPIEDVVYAAYQAGVNVNDALDPNG